MSRRSETTDIPLRFFPATTETEARKTPTELHGVLTLPTTKPEESDVAVLMLHGAGGDLHSGHLVGPCD